jgi:hypothetical protein
VYLKAVGDCHGRVLQTGTVTVKNSGARNLYRLLQGLQFIATLLEILSEDAAVTLRVAATEVNPHRFVEIPFHNCPA